MYHRFSCWYWETASERQAFTFIGCGFLFFWLAAALVFALLGAGWASLIMGMFVGIGWNLVISFYNIAHM